jgi:hypothetical protein
MNLALLLAALALALALAQTEVAASRRLAERLRDVLTELKSDEQCTIDQYNQNGPEFTSPGGSEFFNASFVVDGAQENIDKIEKALALNEAECREGKT